MLHETQLKIENQILPKLADPDLNADPTSELSQTLSLSADAIKQYFQDTQTGGQETCIIFLGRTQKRDKLSDAARRRLPRS